MIKINNFFDNSNVKCIAEGGVFSIYEHQHDLSVDSNTAMNSYFYGADECKETSSTV